MVHWVATDGPGRIGILAHPRGGDRLEDEMRRLGVEGAHVLVSLLGAEEVLQLGLGEEASAAAGAGLAFVSHPIEDHGVPTDRTAFAGLVNDLAAHLGQGSHVAIHCWAGIGRSSLLAASVLAARGVAVSRAFELLSACRGLRVPDTPEQAGWASAFAAELRSGAGESHSGE